ncbi:hypothetical protein E2C01_054002 [Portunus trituberculatus]|uniref:Uncharacterized protein n=1 Tax=Portunus trituberculatus TaxID=210409 RepID=A0A5B7GQW1_PORTR|nr:hypothetical protein [Portunus trituberculatus]
MLRLELGGAWRGAQGGVVGGSGGRGSLDTGGARLDGTVARVGTGEVRLDGTVARVGTGEARLDGTVARVGTGEARD